LNRKRIVPDFEADQEKRRKKKLMREERKKARKKRILAPEGAPTKVPEGEPAKPRMKNVPWSFVKEFFDLFDSKWKDKTKNKRKVRVKITIIHPKKKKQRQCKKFEVEVEIPRAMYVTKYLPEINNATAVDICTFENPERDKPKIYHTSTKGDIPIVFDTGASMSLTPLREDFEGEVTAPLIKSMHGLKDEVKVIGVGKVSWTVFDAFGVVE
jgi:hypothetical protein